MIFRGSCSQMFFKIGVLKNFAVLDRAFLIKLQAFFYRTPAVAASGFSRQQIPFSAKFSMYWSQSHRCFCPGLLWKHELNLRSSHCSCFVNVFLEILQISQEKHLYWSLFLIELQAFKDATLLKRDSNTDVFQWSLPNF